MRKVVLGLLVLFAALGVHAQGVDTDELSGMLERTVNFQNFTGTYARVDSLASIRAIGQGLAEGIRRDASAVTRVGDKYLVHHILGSPEEPGLPADILELLPNAGVDHIDNIRRILAAYLERAYGYSARDARTLSVFITVYNAVHRPDGAFFSARYKASVMKVIRPDAAGLALNYRDWPGKTQIFIPLARNIKDSAASATVTVSALVTPEVIETVRDKTDRGIEERKDLAKLADTAIDDERDKLEADKAALAAREKALEEAKAAVEAKTNPEATPATKEPGSKEPAAKEPGTAAEPGAAKTTAPGTTAAETKPAGPAAVTESKPAADKTATAAATSTESASKTDTAVASKESIAAETKAIEAEKTSIAEREKDLETAEKAVDALRESTAEDIKDLANPPALTAVPQLFAIARVEEGMVVSTLQRVNPQTAEVLKEVPGFVMVGKSLIAVGEQYLVLKWEKSRASLVLLEKENLTASAESKEALSPFGDVLYIPGSGIYGTVLIDGVSYVGRFNEQLVLEKRSILPVDKASAFKVLDSVIYVQRTDGRIAGLALKDLTSVK